MKDIGKSIIMGVESGEFALSFDATLLKVNSIISRLTSYPKEMTENFFRGCVGVFFKEIAAFRALERYGSPHLVSYSFSIEVKDLEREVGDLISGMENQDMFYADLAENLATLLMKVSAIAACTARAENKYSF